MIPILSQLISDLPEKVLSPSYVFIPFNSLSEQAINNTQNPPSLIGFGNDHLHGVSRCTIDVAHLRDHLHCIEDTEGKEAGLQVFYGLDEVALTDLLSFSVPVESLPASGFRSCPFFACLL